MMHLIARCRSTAIPTALGLALSVTRALAEDGHDHADGGAAEAAAPGLTGLGLLVAAVLAVSVWFHVRRVSMLRAQRREAAQRVATAERAGPPSANP
jgi:hypothetical protein